MTAIKQEIPAAGRVAELVSMQGDLERQITVQDRFIRQFQDLTRREGASFVIDGFPCPVAIYERGGVLRGANRALLEKTDLRADQIPAGKTSFLDRITDENYALAEAAEGVFYGKTALLGRLFRPLGLFCQSLSHAPPDDCRSALLFPLPDKDGQIRLGVVMLMK